eukprot:876600-Amphidinium_carterae.1
MVGPKLRERPEAWPRIRLLAPAEADAVVPPWLDQGSLNLKLRMWKDHICVWLLTLTLPGAWNATGKQ